MLTASFSSGSPPAPPSLLSLPLVRRRRNGRGARVARVSGGDLGGFYGATLGLAAWARTPRAAMPGVRATATRHAIGGCGARVRVCGAGGRGGRAVTGMSRSRVVRELAGDASERCRGGEEKRKRGGAAVGAPCRGAGDAAERSEREPGSRRLREKGESWRVGPARQLPQADGKGRVATLRDGGLGRWCWAVSCGLARGKERGRERESWAAHVGWLGLHELGRSLAIGPRELGG
jgi:hypothetical protein